MRSRRVALICSIAALAALSTACGDDPSPAVGAGAEAPPEDLASTLPPAAGTGRGTIQIDGDAYGFDADICALTPVSHRGMAFDLYVHGTGNLGDRSFEVVVLRTAGDDGTRIESVSIDTGEDRVITATNAVPAGQTDDELGVSDTLLSGTMEFASTTGEVKGDGRVDLTCS